MNFKTRHINCNIKNSNDKLLVVISMIIILILVIVILIQQNKIYNFVSILNNKNINFTNKILDNKSLFDKRIEYNTSEFNNKNNSNNNSVIINDNIQINKVFGIDNFFNTCYLNSALQLIFSQINFVGYDRFFNFYYENIDKNKINLVTTLQDLYESYNTNSINKNQIIKFLDELDLEFGIQDSPIMIIYSIFDTFMKSPNVFYNENFSTELLKISTCNSDSSSPMISFCTIDLKNLQESMSIMYHGLPCKSMINNFFIRESDHVIHNALIIGNNEYGNKSFFMTVAAPNIGEFNFKNNDSLNSFINNMNNIKQTSDPIELFNNVEKISIPVSFEFNDCLYNYRAKLLGWIEPRSFHYVCNILDKNSVFNINDNIVKKIIDVKSNTILANAPYITAYGVERLTT